MYKFLGRVETLCKKVKIMIARIFFISYIASKAFLTVVKARHCMVKQEPSLTDYAPRKVSFYEREGCWKMVGHGRGEWG